MSAKVAGPTQVEGGAGSAGTVLLDVYAVGSLFSISDRFVWSMVKAGKFPRPVKLGARTLWRRSDLDRYAAELQPVTESTDGR